jgi:RNA polymerase subunit RPABC4/transcription elongation factor Spt4
MAETGFREIHCRNCNGLLAKDYSCPTCGAAYALQGPFGYKTLVQTKAPTPKPTSSDTGA